ncbi:hypothetical protein R1sor_022754 [Riccia sorocarpa]|uniref:CCHC-type domain-containing protein n=1 Tax=Riccia sorocarpa TaxID=122646 RepID=A0ABD3GKR6_9MARC
MSESRESYHVEASERKRGASRRLSILTRSGEFLGWSKRQKGDELEEGDMDKDTNITFRDPDIQMQTPRNARGQKLASYASNIRMALFGTPSSPGPTQPTQPARQGSSRQSMPDLNSTMEHSNPLFDDHPDLPAAAFPPLSPLVGTAPVQRQSIATSAQPTPAAQETGDPHHSQLPSPTAHSIPPEVNEGIKDPPDPNAGRPKKSYAAATNNTARPSADPQYQGQNSTANTPLNDEQRKEVVEALNIMPQPEERTDPTKDNFIVRHGVHIRRLKVLGRGQYLVVLGSKEERARILNACPFELNKKFVQIQPWTSNYDTWTGAGRRKPVWVTIVGMNAALEDEGIKILSKLGPLLHMSGIENGQSKFADIRGLVLLNAEVDPPEAAAVTFEEGYVEFELHYEPLPTGCFTCHQEGHTARFCPQITTFKEVNPEDVAAAMDETAKASTSADPPEGNQTKDAEPETKNSEDEDSNSQKSDPAGISVANPYQILDDLNTNGGSDLEMGGRDQEDDLGVQAEGTNLSPRNIPQDEGAAEMEVMDRQKRQIASADIAESSSIKDSGKEKKKKGTKTRSSVEVLQETSAVGELEENVEFEVGTSSATRLMGRNWASDEDTDATIQDSQISTTPQSQRRREVGSNRGRKR